MKFAEPVWLLVGLAACLFMVWRYRRFNHNQRASLTGFVSPRLAAQLTRSLSIARRTAKRVLVAAGVGCLFIALARPQAGFRWEETHRQGRDILFAIDTSRSMLTPDVKPNRLTRAKLAVDDLLDKLDGDGTGLIAFAGNAFLQCPITLDYDAFRASLEALDTSTIPRGGTDIASAIHEAQAAFKTRANTDKILILLSDGEDLGGDAVAAAGAAAKEAVTIFTVGVGTSNGELIPIAGSAGATEFVKDPSGNFVKSRLDEATLRKIAEVTGGLYEPLGQRSQGLTAIYSQGLARFARHDLASRRHKVYFEQFEWPLLAGLLCLLADWFIGTRRREPRSRSVTIGEPVAEAPRFRPKPAAAFGLSVLLAVWPGVAHASPQSAEKAYGQGNFAQARQEYAATAARRPTDARLQFNLGAAAYKTGDFAGAARSFETGLKTDQVPVQQESYYNLGNTQYRLGQQAEKTDPQQITKLWQQAVKSYDAALQIKPGDADAKFNRDLVETKLEQLKKQQQEQNKQQPQNQPNNQAQNQQNKGQQQNQSQRKSDASHGQPNQQQQAPGPRPSKSGQPNAQENQKQNPAPAVKPQLDNQNPAESKTGVSQKQPKPAQETRHGECTTRARRNEPGGGQKPDECLAGRRAPPSSRAALRRSDNAPEDPPFRDW